MRLSTTYRYTVAAALAICALAGPASAQDDIGILLSLDRSKIGLNESAILTVSVSASGQQQLPEPKLPPLPQFQIFSAGSSTNLQVINGVTSYSVTYNYILSPRKVGTFPIRSATMVLNGKRHESNELSITVVQSADEAAGPGFDAATDESGESRDLFVVTEVSKSKAYVDEQVTLYIKFFQGINIMSQPELSAPQTPDFWVNDIPPQKQYYQTVNGRRYLVREVRTALFPTKPGKLNIGSARVSVTVPDRSRRRSRDPFSLFDDLFQQGRNVEIKSRPLTVEVLPLPTAGKTAAFSGGVGSYKISATVDKTEVEVNEAITALVKISGRGNVKSIPEPTLPEMDGFRVEKASSDYKVTNLDDRLGGTKTFEYLLIPRLPGSHRIEPIVLNYFDPDQKKYIEASTAGIDLTVKAGEGVVSADVPYNMVSGQTLDLRETDIRFIKTENGNLRSRGRIALASPVFLAVVALPLAVVLGGLIDVRRKRRLATDIGYARQRRATAEARRRLKKAEEFLKKNDDDASFYAGLSAAVYQFIANKFNVSAHGLTSDEVRNLLQRKKVSDELLEQTIGVLGDADFGRFAGGAGGSTGRKELFERARKTIIGLEKIL